VLRHLFASYHYAVNRSYEKLAEAMGNAPDRARRYVVLLDNPDDGTKLWEMTPAFIRARADRLAAARSAAVAESGTPAPAGSPLRKPG
jgi:hypothetical protein